MFIGQRLPGGIQELAWLAAVALGETMGSPASLCISTSCCFSSFFSLCNAMCNCPFRKMSTRHQFAVFRSVCGRSLSNCLPFVPHGTLAMPNIKSTAYNPNINSFLCVIKKFFFTFLIS